MNISEGDVTLYDSEDEKISAVNVYDSSDKFKTLGYESLSKDKTLSRYTVFEVDPEEEYELHYSPKFIDSLAKDRKEIEIKVKPSKYTDQTGKEVVTTVQSILDSLLPGLLALLLTFGCMHLLKRKVNAIWIIFGFFAIGIIGFWLGILA